MRNSGFSFYLLAYHLDEHSLCAIIILKVNFYDSTHERYVVLSLSKDWKDRFN